MPFNQKKMKLGDWINRKRHNRGFGIQSPSAFFFITQVLKERLPYYAYPALDNVAGGGRARKRHLRELFRITNYQHPNNCISIGAVDAACAMALARPSVQHCAIAPGKITADAQQLLSERGCHIVDSAKHLPAIIEQMGPVGMLYINATNDAYPLVKAALPHTNNNSIIVVDGINRNKTIREWWQQLVNDSATIVTYDMYSYGLLFFDKEKRKQHYTLKR